MTQSLVKCIAFILLFAACKKNNQSTTTDPGPDISAVRWQQYKKENSMLPDNQVNALAINTDTGWVGTNSGLARLVNNQWTIFNTANTPLPSATIQALSIQKNGILWIGTSNGLVRYDGSQWTTYNTGNSILPTNAIMSLHHDSKNNITWVGTANGLIQINAGNQWQLFDDIADELILSMAADTEGGIWLGCFDHFNFRGKIKHFSNGMFSTQQLDQIGYPSAFPYALALTENNKPVAALSGTSVRAIISPINNQWQEWAYPTAAYGIRTMLADGSRLWLGGNLLSVHDKQTAVSFTVPGTANDAGVLSMAKDSKGRIWLGTTGHGLIVFNEKAPG